MKEGAVGYWLFKEYIANLARRALMSIETASLSQ